MFPIRSGLATVAAALSLLAASAAHAGGDRTVIVYDSFSKPGGYTIVDYSMKWVNIYGLGEMASTGGDTRSFAGGKFSFLGGAFHGRL